MQEPHAPADAVLVFVVADVAAGHTAVLAVAARAGARALRRAARAARGDSVLSLVRRTRRRRWHRAVQCSRVRVSELEIN